MICFLDLDGVLTDFVGAATKAHDLQYPPYPEPGNHNMPEAYGLKDDATFWRKFDTEDFWANLDWMPDGREILKLVESAFSTIQILTKPTRNPQCSSGKLRWIQKHIPKYSRNVFIGPKKWLVASENKVLIDDHDKNINNFRLSGGIGILVPRVWNSAYEKDTLTTLERKLKCF